MVTRGMKMNFNGSDIQAVLFDFDGTLTRPGGIDFQMIRNAIGCPPGTPILEFIDTLSVPDERAQAQQILDDMEMDAAAVSEPNSEAEETVVFLKDRGLKLGILSRNSLTSIKRAFINFSTIGPSDFALIVPRDLPLKPKPHPDGILYASETLNIPVERILMVGDFMFDIMAGKAAGAKTAFISNGAGTSASGIDSDLVITHLGELKRIF